MPARRRTAPRSPSPAPPAGGGKAAHVLAVSAAAQAILENVQEALAVLVLLFVLLFL
jgi:hypothetical protein